MTTAAIAIVCTLIACYIIVGILGERLDKIKDNTDQGKEALQEIQNSAEEMMRSIQMIETIAIQETSEDIEIDPLLEARIKKWKKGKAR